jgi:hypothetical protein
MGDRVKKKRKKKKKGLDINHIKPHLLRVISLPLKAKQFRYKFN